MTATEPHYTTAADVFDGWRDDLLTGTPPVFYPGGEGELARIEFGPGRVVLVGGAPGAGKTAFTMQASCDALRLTPSLRCLICNVEMPPAVLLDRQLARLAGIDAELIRRRQLDASHGARLDAGLAAIDAFADRLAFVRAPFDLANVAAAADHFDAGLLLLDYIQRIAPPGTHGDNRNAVNATMGFLRMFADAGLAVVVVAAVGRTKDTKGRQSYAADALNLASFRESSELEFGADDAFILAPDAKDAELVTLRHLKSRHGSTQDLPLHFDKARQAFTPTADAAPAAGPLQAALEMLWHAAGTADEPDEGTADDTF